MTKSERIEALLKQLRIKKSFLERGIITQNQYNDWYVTVKRAIKANGGELDETSL